MPTAKAIGEQGAGKATAAGDDDQASPGAGHHGGETRKSVSGVYATTA